METLVNVFRRRLLPNRKNFDFAQFSVSKFSSSHLDIARRSLLLGVFGVEYYFTMFDNVGHLVHVDDEK